MSEDLHGVVQLLLARMKSHPEEFITDLGGNLQERSITTSPLSGRWWPALNTVEGNGSEADKKAIYDGLYAIRMNEAHEWALDELCNGEERRRQREEEVRAYKLQSTASGASVVPQTNTYYNSQTNVANTGMVATIKKALGI